MKNSGKGAGRKDRRRAKAWMVMNKIRPRDIQVALGHKYHSPVGETLTGVRDNRQVLAWLLDKGCPADYLKLPKDMIKEN
jgi:hypothetical protein